LKGSRHKQTPPALPILRHSNQVCASWPPPRSIPPTAPPWPRRRWRSVSPGARATRVRRCRTLALGWVEFFRRRRGLWHRVLAGKAACPRLRWPPSPVGSRRWLLGCWSPLVWLSAAGCLAWAIAHPCQSWALLPIQPASIDAILPDEWPASC